MVVEWVVVVVGVEVECCVGWQRENSTDKQAARRVGTVTDQSSLRTHPFDHFIWVSLGKPLYPQDTATVPYPISIALLGQR